MWYTPFWVRKAFSRAATLGKLVLQPTPLSQGFSKVILLVPCFFPLCWMLIAKDSCCPLLFHAWYLDDNALAGPRPSLHIVLTLIQELGPPLGLNINISKCEVFSCKGWSSFFPLRWNSHTSLIRIFWEFPLVMLISARPLSFENMSQLNNFCPVRKRLTLKLPLPSFAFPEASVNLSYWLAPHLLCIPQSPLSYLMRMYISALHNVLLWTHLIMPGTRLNWAWVEVVRVSVPSHNTPLQLTLPRFLPVVLALNRNTTLPQQFSCLILLYHHWRQLIQKHFCWLRSPKSASWMTTSSRFFWTCPPSPTRLACCLCFLPSCSIMAVCHSFRGSWSPSQPFSISGCH